MALRQLMLNKKIEQRKSSLAELVEQEGNLKTRSTELEASLEEAKTDEEIALVDEEITKLDTEKADLEEKKSKLEGEIAELEGELEELNVKEPKGDPESKRSKTLTHEREGGNYMERNKFFKGMTREAVEALIQREEVKDFLQRTREFINQKRAVTGGELGVPNIFLGILRDNINQYSKLAKHVFVKPVSGTARQTIAGTVSEAIWTEMISKLNELEIVFNQLEVDGYKVGGYIPVPNSLLEDSDDIALADEIMTYLGQAIGLALDKAILYGKGVKMPVGIVTRLAEIAQPAYWGTKEKAWTDLHVSNLLLIDPAANTDVLFYKDLILKLGKAKANYSNGQKFWAMSSNTFAILQAKALTINAAGAIVSGQNGTMPIVGGAVETLDFIPDNVIIGGYGSLYLLAERAGATLAQSEHVQFIEDNTVFKGTSRYDGRPVFGEGFIAINIDQEVGAVAPTATAVTFAADTANV
ncbi:MAG: hypothetical protein K0Q65_1212 [Clostridia bacterium]|nr:hypothetical protein [Clostridia bacterium]